MCGRTSRPDRGVNGPWARIRSCSRQRGAATSPWSRRSSVSEPKGVVHWQGGCHRGELDTFARRSPFLPVSGSFPHSRLRSSWLGAFGVPVTRHCQCLVLAGALGHGQARPSLSRIRLSNRRSLAEHVARRRRAPLRRAPIRVSPIRFAARMPSPRPTYVRRSVCPVSSFSPRGERCETHA